MCFVLHYEKLGEENKSTSVWNLPLLTNTVFLSFYSSVLLLMRWKATGADKALFGSRELDNGLCSLLFSAARLDEGELRSACWRRISRGWKLQRRVVRCLASSSLKILKGFKRLPMCLSTLMLYTLLILSIPSLKKESSNFLSFFSRGVLGISALLVQIFPRFWNTVHVSVSLPLEIVVEIKKNWNIFWILACINSFHTCTYSPKSIMMISDLGNRRDLQVSYQNRLVRRKVVRSECGDAWEMCAYLRADEHTSLCQWTLRAFEPQELISQIRILVGKRD